MDGLTYEEAHQLFRYDPDTGQMFWRVNIGRKIKAGNEAGSIIICGRTAYRQVGISGKVYRVHRLIWMMRYGSWPEHEIDHLDGDGCNNRIDNLRDVPCTVNRRNRRMNRNNTSGKNGVTWYKLCRKWVARVYDESGQRKYLGIFADIRDAEKAVREYQKPLGFTERNGSQNR